jgi:glycosyltransferase involved in cell wall biosynthesis
MNSQTLAVQQEQATGYAKKVSVLMITYNHEQFIAQAIESALAQVTDFDYEIVIGEDYSTDRTRDIIASFADKYPDRVRPLYREVNLGMNRNFIQTLLECKGQYVAVLEGDDYWTHSDKLQKQGGFLDTHPGYAMCFHNVSTVYENQDKLAHHWHHEGMRDTFTLLDLLDHNYINTCSIMFRRGLIPHFPERFYSLGMGDWPLHILNAQHGLIGYIDQPMAVYRIHAGGIWSLLNKFRHWEVEVDVLQFLQVHLRPVYRPAVQVELWRRLYLLAWQYAMVGDYYNAKLFTKKYLRARLIAFKAIDKSVIRLLTRIYAPVLFIGIHRTLQLLQAPTARDKGKYSKESV